VGATAAHPHEQRQVKWSLSGRIDWPLQMPGVIAMLVMNSLGVS
jgi:hypothetical protein